MINIPILLLIIGLLGLILNRKHLILILLSLELMILGATLIIIISGIEYNDSMSQLLTIYIISLTGSETAIGLGIIIAYYRVRGDISLS